MDKKAIGMRIKELRRAKRLTVEECCAAANVSPSAWRKYEIGERIPRDEVKVAIADFFNRSVKTIFFDD